MRVDPQRDLGHRADTWSPDTAPASSSAWVQTRAARPRGDVDTSRAQTARLGAKWIHRARRQRVRRENESRFSGSSVSRRKSRPKNPQTACPAKKVGRKIRRQRVLQKKQAEKPAASVSCKPASPKSRPRGVSCKPASPKSGRGACPANQSRACAPSLDRSTAEAALASGSGSCSTVWQQSEPRCGSGAARSTRVADDTPRRASYRP